MDSVEIAFANLAKGKIGPPKVLGLNAKDGGVHIKAGMMNFNSNYIVAKMNSNFPGNRNNFNMPTIQGAIAVFNADNGALLALMDSIEITIVRTGAATGIAANWLSRKNSKSMTIYGCGNQGKISFEAVTAVRELETVYLYDADKTQAERLATVLRDGKPGVSIISIDDPKESLNVSDIIITCTTSQTPIVDAHDVKPGTFIAAVGCDSEEKNEIHPNLIATSKLVTDITEQSVVFGDLHHAIKLGIIDRAHVHAELGEVIAGIRPGRENEDEIIVFDSTGTGLQDVTAAAIVYQKALANSVGLKFSFQN